MAYNFDYLSGYSPGGSLVDYSSGLSTQVNGFNGVSSKSSNSSNMWGAIASAAGGVVSSLINGNSAKKQFKYQQKLNAQQQEYARENATTAYNRQRELTVDNPLLQKIGMRNAGMSTAFTDGSSVGAASSVDQAAAPNAGSAPEIPQVGNLFAQGAQAVASVADLAMKRAQIAQIKSDVANKNADTQGKTIDNVTKAEQNLADLENTKADTKGKAAKAHIDETQGKILDATGMGTAVANQNLAESNAAIAAADASVRVDQNRLDIQQRIASIQNTLANTEVSNQRKKNLEEELKNLIKQRDVMDSQISANKASAYASYASGADSYSHVGVNNATAANIKEDTYSKKLDNFIKYATKDDVIKAAHLSAQEHGPQSLNDYAWSVFNNWDNATVGEKFRACLSLPFGWFERVVGGASDSYAQQVGKEFGSKPTTKKPTTKKPTTKKPTTKKPTAKKTVAKKILRK